MCASVPLYCQRPRAGAKGQTQCEYEQTVSRERSSEQSGTSFWEARTDHWKPQGTSEGLPASLECCVFTPVTKPIVWRGKVTVSCRCGHEQLNCAASCFDSVKSKRGLSTSRCSLNGSMPVLDNRSTQPVTGLLNVLLITVH